VFTARRRPCCESGQTATLLTAAIEIRAQRVLREVLFPEAGGQEMDVEGRMGIDALEHIGEVDVWTHPL
jgi:hypothetical protein